MGRTSGEGSGVPTEVRGVEGLGGNGQTLLLSHAHRHHWPVASSPRVRPRFHTAEAPTAARAGCLLTVLLGAEHPTLPPRPLGALGRRGCGAPGSANPA